MGNYLKRVYKHTSTYSEVEMRNSIDKNLSESEIEFIAGFDTIDFYYDGNKYTWNSELPDLTAISFIHMSDDEIKKIKEIEYKIVSELKGESKFEDLTEEVLYDLHDCDQYGFANDHVRIFFHEWRLDNLESDDILDKISKYGIESITQQEKDFLETGILNNPYDYIIDPL